MKPIARINLSYAALRRGSGKCCQCGSVAKTNSNCQGKENGDEENDDCGGVRDDVRGGRVPIVR